MNMAPQPDPLLTSRQNASHHPTDGEDEDDTFGTAKSVRGMSPYSTGGGGVTFERKVAVHYLAKLLVGEGAVEFGDGRHVESVAFQQSPSHATDDLVVRTVSPEEMQPSWEIALAVRRSPNIVQSNQRSQELFEKFIRDLINIPEDGIEHRFGLVVSGHKPHAEQLASLADLAAAQMDAPGFFDLVRTPNAFDANVRLRLEHVEGLVKRALEDISQTIPSDEAVQRRTWQLLSNLYVMMPRFETPDESDWSTVTDRLISVGRGSDLEGATRLRDRLISLASEYPQRSARIDLKLLRRDAYETLDSDVRRYQKGWDILHHMHQAALGSVRNEIGDADGVRIVSLEREEASAELASVANNTDRLIVSGESGVGKSSLALRTLIPHCATTQAGGQALCFNLRHMPESTVEFESTLGCPLSTLLNELSAPFRVLIVDGADAATEGREDAFRYLVDAALESDVRLVAIASEESKGIVRDVLADPVRDSVSEFEVEQLTDGELEEIIATFPELENLYANRRSREIMRRLVVVDLLVRGDRVGKLVTNADAMQQIWTGLVRRGEKSDRGYPDARETALLKLADLSLGNGERLDVVNSLDPAALAGLRQDGLLQSPTENPYSIGPEFAHDEVRRYAVARLLASERDPTAKLSRANAPRWTLGAATLACQLLLQEPDRIEAPLNGRFQGMQNSFDALVASGFGPRWGDVPSEALVTMADPGAMLDDAWSSMHAHEAFGLRRLCRVINQRLRTDNDFVRLAAIEPVIKRLLDDETPWKLGDYATDLLRDWLHAHVYVGSADGDPLRIILRERLVAACEDAERRLAEQQKAAKAARLARSREEDEKARRFAERYPYLVSERDSHEKRLRRLETVPMEWRDEVVVELMALLGPEIDDRCEAILRRVAEDAPDWLAPAVEEPLCGWSLANSRPGLLAELTESYYLDSDVDMATIFEDGIRGHEVRSGSLYLPLAGPDRGPFRALFLSDIRGGAAVLNRLLNHAARIRARKQATPHGAGDTPDEPAVGANQLYLNIDGSSRLYIGDDQVWRWYRGTSVGPYPCMSALFALERVADQMIAAGASIEIIVSVLLEGCENLAMVGLAVGLIVRNLEVSGNILDSFLAEPIVWEYEFSRVASEDSILAYDSPDIGRSDRRNWSMRDASVALILQAAAEREASLRLVGERLVERAHEMAESWRTAEGKENEAIIETEIDRWLMMVRGWASSLDRDNIRVAEGQDGLIIQQTQPEEVARELQPGNEDLKRAAEAIRLTSRYFTGPNEPYKYPNDPDAIYVDAVSARDLLDSPPSLNAHDPWNVPAVVAAATLDAQLVRGISVPKDALAFASDTVVRVAEGEPPKSPLEVEESYFERGADRSAARALPLLLLPAASELRAVIDGSTKKLADNRVSVGGMNLARAIAVEVRLHLARGLDHLWTSSCARDGTCHHQVGWRIATETARYSSVGDWDHAAGKQTYARLEDPLVEAIRKIPDDAILPSRLDASIRALAPAAMANICVSASARELLATLLDAQRRSLIHYDEQGRDVDPRGAHSLVGARALLTLASDGDEALVYEHVDACAHDDRLVEKLLRALSAAAEETEGLAATARRVWPSIIRRALKSCADRNPAFSNRFRHETAHAALIPNPAPENTYLYRELEGKPIAWWQPLAMRSEVEEWLVEAAGSAVCVDQLITFLAVLSPEDKALVCFPWVAELVLADPGQVAKRSWHLAKWLKETRFDVAKAGHGDRWQSVVDALVVAGNAYLAPYSV